MNLLYEGAIPAKPVSDVPPRGEGRLSLWGRAGDGHSPGLGAVSLASPGPHCSGLSRCQLPPASRECQPPLMGPAERMGPACQPHLQVAKAKWVLCCVPT